MQTDLEEEAFLGGFSEEQFRKRRRGEPPPSPEVREQAAALERKGKKEPDPAKMAAGMFLDKRTQTERALSLVRAIEEWEASVTLARAELKRMELHSTEMKAFIRSAESIFRKRKTGPADRKRASLPSQAPVSSLSSSSSSSSVSSSAPLLILASAPAGLETVEEKKKKKEDKKKKEKDKKKEREKKKKSGQRTAPPAPDLPAGLDRLRGQEQKSPPQLEPPSTKTPT